MSLQLIGAGVGRTGTMSLKLALNRLGLGPCHHMDAVLQGMPVHVPLWSAALKGQPDWEAIYEGFNSAVDWPTAGFFRELVVAYPEVKFVLTHRSPESWVDSFEATIYKVTAEKNQAPPEQQDWLEMAGGVIAHTGFPLGLDRDDLMKAFIAHNEAVRNEIPANRLLVYQVTEGWEPLCDFLGLPAPSEPFPRSNAREEFWDLMSGEG
jgi:hypothetical protein